MSFQARCLPPPYRSPTAPTDLARPTPRANRQIWGPWPPPWPSSSSVAIGLLLPSRWRRRRWRGGRGILGTEKLHRHRRLTLSKSECLPCPPPIAPEMQIWLRLVVTGPGRVSGPSLATVSQQCLNGIATPVDTASWDSVSGSHLLAATGPTGAEGSRDPSGGRVANGHRHRVGARYGAELLHPATLRMCARERSADLVGGLLGVGAGLAGWRRSAWRF